MIGNPDTPQPFKKTIKQNFRNDLYSVRRLMFIMIGEMKNFITSISGILFGDTNVRETSGKVPSSDGRARKEKIDICPDRLERMVKCTEFLNKTITGDKTLPLHTTPKPNDKAYCRQRLRLPI